MAVLTQVLIIKINDCRGDGEPQPFVASTFCEHEGVDADEIAIDIYQRTATVSRIDGRISLDIDHGIVWIGLPGDRTDHTHSDRIPQSFGTPNREYQFALADADVTPERHSRQMRCLYFEQS